MMRLYVSGPMTGKPDLNKPAFAEAAGALHAAGFDVVNPAAWTGGPDYSWEDYMRVDLRLLLDCDGVAVLPGWLRSRGARLEVHVARNLGLPIKRVHEWATQQVSPA
jgi:hypothetical protein